MRVAVVVAALVGGPATHAYTTYARWSTAPTFWLNPANSDGVPAAGVEAAISAGLAAWNGQSGASFESRYGGRVSDTSIANDRRNVVFFRNTTNGSAIASTYAWWDATGQLLDADIIFWDGGFRFFADTACSGSNAAYIQDIAAHEFGHAIGLNHSTASSATMYPAYSTCSTAQRSLATDDLAGLSALYPSSAVSTNVAPVVTITKPTASIVVSRGTVVSLAGTALDAEDGTISSSIRWVSSIDGGLGWGSTVSAPLSVGAHTIKARVTDSDGVTKVDRVSVTVQ